MTKPIGLRNVKTALSVSLCLAIGHLLNLQYPFFSAIAAVITMGNSLTGSFTDGKNRLLGTLLGAVIGILLASFQPYSLLLCALGIILIIFFCTRLGWKGSVTISCIVFLSIMINLNGGNPIRYGLFRTLETFIGVTVALLVNSLLFPHDILKKLDRGCNQFYPKLLQAKNHIGNLQTESHLESLRKEWDTLRERLSICRAETRFGANNPQQLERLSQVVLTFEKCLRHLEVLHEMGDTLPEGHEVKTYHHQEIQTHFSHLNSLMNPATI